MYRWNSGRAILLVSVYVNDLIITSTDEKEVAAFKAQMMKAFEMSDLGLLSFYLGVEVRQLASGINLLQTHYADRILELGGMEGCNPAATPMEERLKLSRFSTAEAVDPTHYRRLIGSLHFLVHTRPDILSSSASSAGGEAHHGAPRSCEAHPEIPRRDAGLRVALHQSPWQRPLRRLLRQ
jgi:hypothetical protein